MPFRHHERIRIPAGYGNVHNENVTRHHTTPLKDLAAFKSIQVVFFEGQSRYMVAAPTVVNVYYEEQVQDLFDLARILTQAFDEAGLEYRVIGGLATFLYIEEIQPDSGRLTKDIDIVVRRDDLER